MYQEHKTIFAPATHPGKAGVAIIRVSGDKAKTIFGSICKISNPKARNAIFSTFFHPETLEIIDKGIVIYFPKTSSFTGEDVVELHIHGSIAIINILMDILSNFEDFRVALPGEFAKRAFLNGKMDLTMAEGLADLIDSETSLQQKQAIRQMSGELQNLYDTWRVRIIKIMANIEAYIDFPDEDIPDNLTKQMQENVSVLINNITSHLQDNNKGEKLRTGLLLAIIGKPNAGKSSLLNYLAKREVAIVSNIAGTTRDIIEVHLDISGIPVTVADTAGIRESEDLIEKEGVKRAIEKSKNADFNIIIFDSNDNDLNNLIHTSNDIIIINKIDQQFDKSKFLNIFKDPIFISIKENINLDLLMKKIEEKARNLISATSDPVITRTRYRNHLEACLANLKLFSLDKNLELAAEDLRLASREIEQITGIIDVEVILDEIFSNFCIGK